MPKGLRRSSSDQSILTTNVKPRWLEWVQKIRIIFSNIMPKSKNCTSINVFYVLAPKTNSSYIIVKVITGVKTFYNEAIKLYTFWF